MTTTELLAFCTILTPVFIFSQKEYLDSLDKRATRLRNANDLLSASLNNYILKGTIPTAAELTVLERRITQKHEVDIIQTDDISTAICNGYIKFFSKHRQITQFQYNLKMCGRKFEEDWVKLQFLGKELLQDSYITTLFLFSIFSINGWYKGINMGQKDYCILLVFVALLSVMSQFPLQLFFNKLNENARKEKESAAKKEIESLCR